MKKRALRKDFHVEIKKSLNRFLSIFFIVALGVAFYSGIQASAPDMRATGDWYFDESDLMDIRVISTLGLTEEDLSVIEATEGVGAAAGCYMEDVFCGEDDVREVLHVESIPEGMNTLTVSEGELPQKAGECFLDSSYAQKRGYQVGDTLEITVSSQDDTILRRQEFTISGIGHSPCYISFGRGSTTLGNGSLSGFVYLLPEDFDSQVFGVIYATVEGAKEEMAFSDEYDDLVEAVCSRIEDITDERCQVRYGEVMDEAQQTIDDAKQEVEDGKQEVADAKQELAEGEAEAESELAEAESELIDGEAQLRDGERELMDARSEVKEGQQKINDGIEEIDANREKLADGRAQIEAGEATLASGEAKYQSGLQQYNREAASGKKKLDAAQKKIDAGKAQVDQGWTDYNTNLAQIEAGEAQLAQAETTLSQQQAAYDEGVSQLAEAWSQYEAAAANLPALQEGYQAAQSQAGQLQGAVQAAEAQAAGAQSEYDGAQAAVNDLNARIQETKASLEGAAEEQREELQAILDELNGELPGLTQAAGEKQAALQEALGALEGARQGLETAQATASSLQQQIDAVNAAKQTLDQKDAELAAAAVQLAAGWQQLEGTRTQLASGREELDKGKATLEATEKELKDAQKEVDEGYAELTAAKDKLDEARKELDSGWAQLDASKGQIADGERQIADGEQELEEARKELDEAREQLAEGQKELEENKAKLRDGWRDYRKGRQEADDKLADGRQKIAEAEEELADAQEKIADGEEELAELKYPEWYVNDRSVLPEHMSFGENADRLSNIAKVVPVLFFIVAALISLTTMTRMVEEERTQIGTLKALGYSKGAIASKYLKYAFLATLGGCGFGVLFGEKIFPWIIINAYGIMFQYLPRIVIPYNLTYALLASAAALVCTLGATFSACCRELLAVPAELMRPPAPKEGKRVWLEYIPFLWRRLSFSWKSTVRNLIRYKKRFLMTVIGIGGCMGLLLVGYGLQDSIMEIAVLQFGDLHLYDAMVILDTEASREEQEKPLDMLREDERVTAATRFFAKQQEVQTEGITKKEWSLYVYVPENVEEFEQFFCLRDRSSKEEYKLTDEGAVLTEKIAGELNVHAGDTITLKQEEGGDIQVPVLAVCENYLYHYLYMTPALYERLYGEAPEYNSIFWSSDEDQEVIERIGENILSQDAALNITYAGTLAEQLDNMLGALDIVMVVIIISAGMLAFVVLYNLNNININERRRELATLKVLGFYDGEVAAYVYRENILLTVIGAALGIFIGKFLHMYVITTVEVDSCMFGRTINLASFVYGTLFTVGFSIIVNLVMYFKLKKIDMVESLKSIE